MSKVGLVYSHSYYSLNPIVFGTDKNLDSDTPEIKMEKHMSADRSSMHIEIYCTVHAEPQAVVRWA